MHRRISLLPLLAMPTLVFGCFGDPPATDDSGTLPDDTGEITREVTWYQDIQPMVMENCAGCHFSGSALSTMWFDSYEGSRGLATLMLTKMEGDDRIPFTMPPFPPPDGYDDCQIPRPIDPDPRMGETDLALFRAWVDQGMPEGDPKNPTPFDQQPPPTLEGLPNVLESPELAIDVPPAHDGDIDFNKCMTFGLGLTETRYIKSVEVVPDLPGIIHHTIVSTDPAGMSTPETGDPDAVAGCPEKMVDSVMLTTYTLGQQPLTFPDNSGYKVEPGARIVLAWHYHMGAEAVTDHPLIRIQFTDGDPMYLAFMDRYGGASISEVDWDFNSDRHEGWTDGHFEVPAGESDWVEVWKQDRANDPPNPDPNDPDLPDEPYPVWGVFPHMHYAGSHIRISYEHSDGSETCLAHIGPWDAAWQQNYVYQYDDPSDLPVFYPDDVVNIECHYDNTTANERLMEGLAESGFTEPIDMTVGEGSLKEMCVMHYGVLMPLE